MQGFRRRDVYPGNVDRRKKRIDHRLRSDTLAVREKRDYPPYRGEPANKETVWVGQFPVTIYGNKIKHKVNIMTSYSIHEIIKWAETANLPEVKDEKNIGPVIHYNQKGSISSWNTSDDAREIFDNVFHNKLIYRLSRSNCSRIGFPSEYDNVYASAKSILTERITKKLEEA